MREKHKKIDLSIAQKNATPANVLDFLPILSKHFNSFFSFINDNGNVSAFSLFISFHFVSLLLFDYKKSKNSDNKEKAKERN